MRARSVSSEPMLSMFITWALIGVLLSAACINTDFQFLLELMIYTGAAAIFQQAKLRVPVVFKECVR